jgi:hypothetical protein
MSTNTILATTPLVSTNYLLRATGTTIGNSLIFDNGTNVGIGNTNTSYTLDVSGTGNFSGILTTGSNVGIGVTPSAWYNLAAYVALQVGNASLFGRNSANSELYLSSNVFDNSSGAATYITTDFASRYIQNDGTHTWLTAPSGTAGTAVTFTPRMTILQGGNVGIGTSSPDFPLTVKTDASANSIKILGRSSGDTSISWNSADNLTQYAHIDIGASYSQLYSNSNFQIFASTNQATGGAYNTFGNLYVASTSGQGTDIGGSISIGGKYNGAGAYATFARIQGKKENSSSGQTGGYLAFEVCTDLTNLNTERMRITSGGQVQIKQSANSHNEGLSLINTGNQVWNFVNGGDSNLYLGYAGNSRGYFNSSTGVYTPITPSDSILKDNIINYNRGLSELLKLEVKEWEYNGKAGTMAGEKTIGFIADQIVNVIPEWVSEYDVKLEESDEEKTQVKRIITNDLQYLLVKAIQELSKQNEELSNRLIKLESK